MQYRERSKFRVESAEKNHFIFLARKEASCRLWKGRPPRGLLIIRVYKSLHFLLTYITADLSERIYHSALITFLRQEVDRMNKLLETISKSLTQLCRAVKGEIIMSEELEDIYHSILEQTIPTTWKVRFLHFIFEDFFFLRKETGS